MTSSAIVDISRMAKYTNRRSVTYAHTQRKKAIENDVSYVISVQHTSFDWNSFVTAKNVSVASVEFRGVPYRREKHKAIHIHDGIAQMMSLGSRPLTTQCMVQSAGTQSVGHPATPEWFLHLRFHVSATTFERYLWSCIWVHCMDKCYCG